MSPGLARQESAEASSPPRLEVGASRRRWTLVLLTERPNSTADQPAKASGRAWRPSPTAVRSSPPSAAAPAIAPRARPARRGRFLAPPSRRARADGTACGAGSGHCKTKVCMAPRRDAPHLTGHLAATPGHLSIVEGLRRLRRQYLARIATSRPPPRRRAPHSLTPDALWITEIGLPASTGLTAHGQAAPADELAERSRDERPSGSGRRRAARAGSPTAGSAATAVSVESAVEEWLRELRDRRDRTPDKPAAPVPIPLRRRA